MTSRHIRDAKTFVYFSAGSANNNKAEQERGEITSDLLDKILTLIGREALKEKTPTIKDLEQSVQDLIASRGHRKKDENMGGMYVVRYHEICESLKKEIFEDVIMEKYGFKGLRIVRLLYEKGKLDEKAVSF